MEVAKNILNLPPRSRGAYSNKFRKVDVVSNHFKVTLKNIDKVVVYTLNIEPRIDRNDTNNRQKIVQLIIELASLKIKNPVFMGFNVFSSQECS